MTKPIAILFTGARERDLGPPLQRSLSESRNDWEHRCRMNRQRNINRWHRIVVRATFSLLGDTPPRYVRMIVGDCNGIDQIAENFAANDGWPSEVFRADWSNGKSGGPKRNKAMLDRLLELQNEGYEAHVLAFHPDITKSRGTANMMKQAERAGIPVSLFNGKEVEV